MTDHVKEISIALGDRPAERLLKENKITCPRVKLNYADYPVISRAFAPMVRTLAFDISELALVTFLQALEAGKPLRLIPIVISSGMHHGSIYYDPEKGAVKPGDLKGKRVGMRAYTQTTGMWARGVLSEQYGLPLDEVTWVTREEAHVAEYTPPANVEMQEGDNEFDMLRRGDTCAVFATAAHVKGKGLAPLIADAEAAAAEWYAKHKVVMLNHMMVVTEDFQEKYPFAVQDVYDMLCKATDEITSQNPGKFPMSSYGADRIWDEGAIQLAMEYGIQQKLLSRVFTKEEIFANVVG